MREACFTRQIWPSLGDVAATICWQEQSNSFVKTMGKSSIGYLWVLQLQADRARNRFAVQARELLIGEEQLNRLVIFKAIVEACQRNQCASPTTNERIDLCL